MSNQVNSFPAVQLYFVHQKRFFRTQKHIFTTFYHFSVFFSKKLLTFSKHSDIMYQSFGYSACIYPLISLLSRQDNNEIWVQRRWQRATLGWQRPWVQIPLLRPKSEVQSNLRFSFIFYAGRYASSLESKKRTIGTAQVLDGTLIKKQLNSSKNRSSGCGAVGSALPWGNYDRKVNS